jgi:hypothetical protein
MCPIRFVMLVALQELVVRGSWSVGPNFDEIRSVP